MSRVIVLGVLCSIFIIGCSDKKEKLKVNRVDANITQKDVNVTQKVKNDVNLTKKVEVKKIETLLDRVEGVKKNMMVIEEEFIPEHVRKSHIEVVEH